MRALALMVLVAGADAGVDVSDYDRYIKATSGFGGPTAAVHELKHADYWEGNFVCGNGATPAMRAYAPDSGYAKSWALVICDARKDAGQ